MTTQHWSLVCYAFNESGKITKPQNISYQFYNKMKPFKVQLTLLITVLIWVWNSKSDLVAAPKDKDPTETVIIKSVPGKSKVYNSDFKVRHIPISVIAGNDGILSTERLAVENLNDSIQAKLTGLAIAGGESSNPRYIEIPGQPSRVVADYLLNGVKYTLTMEKTGFIKLSTSTLLYQLKSLDDLPAGIQKFISAKNRPNSSDLLSLKDLDEKLKETLQRKNELIFEACSVFQLPNGAKHYRVYVNYYGLTTLPLIFDEKGSLVWVANFNRLESLKNLEDLTGGPAKIVDSDLNQFKSVFSAATELKSFKLASSLNSDASKNVYGGVTGYEFNLVNSSESWHLAYSNSKELVDGYYSGWVK